MTGTQRGKFKIEWIDRGRSPRMPANPKYPDGMALNFARPGVPACTVDLPYPARRLGVYKITCETCGFIVACTTAGRRDDPNKITIECKEG